jgi:methyl-accepting chemotaxis protein
MEIRRGRFRATMILISIVTSSLSVILLSLYLYVILNPTADELNSIIVVVMFLFPSMLVIYLLLLYRYITPIELILAGNRYLGEEELQKVYLDIVSFPLKATLLAVFTWLVGAFVASIAAYFIFSITGAIYVFTGVVTGGTIGPLLAYFYFKKYTMLYIEKIIKNFNFSGSFLDGRVVLNLRTKLLSAFIILLIESLGLSGLLTYEKISIFVQRRNSEYAVNELRNILNSNGVLTDFSQINSKLQPVLAGKDKRWYLSLISETGRNLDGYNGIKISTQELNTIKNSSTIGSLFRRSKDVIAYLPLHSEGKSVILYIPWRENNGEILGLGKLFLVQILVTFFVYCFFAFLISDDVSFYVRKMSDLAQGISRGLLNQEIPPPTEDEIGVLADSIRMMSDNLKGIVQRIERASSNVNDAIHSIIGSYESVSQGSTTQKELISRAYNSLIQLNDTVAGLAESAEIVSKSIGESTRSVIGLTSAVQGISKKITSISESANQVASSTEQMSMSIADVSRNIDFLSGSSDKIASAVVQIDRSVKAIETDATEGRVFSEKVRLSAESGVRAVNESIEGIKRIEDGSLEVSSAIDTLRRRTEDITRIVEVIDDITEETNLLALNAAIIAAQAGEHGKGFSVVADEVRGLAERTFNSTKEISEIIKKASDDSLRATRIMEEQKKKINSGVELALKSGDVLRQILDHSVVALERMSNIAKAITELASVSVEVTKEMNKTAETIKNSASALKKQADSGETIVKAVEQIRDAVFEVKNSIKEQEKGSNVIARNIQSVDELIEYLIKSVNEQNEKSRTILSDMERVKTISETNEEKAKDLNEVIKVLSAESELLEQEVKRFKI